MAKLKHGHTAAGRTSSTYRIWQMMRDRCNNERSGSYRHYGGRGIRVCERWEKFENFLADMGERPDGLEIDRIDNDGDYEPGNCRWVTIEQNQNNKRTNHLLTHNGETMTVTQWAKRIGCSAHALLFRVRAGRMTVDECITVPFGDPYETRRYTSGFARIEYGGESLTAHQWAKRTGLLPGTINFRLKAGWTPERTLTTPSRQARKKAA